RSPAQLAAMTGRPQAEVEAAIKEAEASRTLLRYKAVVDWEKAGEEQVWALIEVKVTPQRDVGFDAVAERIYRFPEARSVYLVSGTYDLAVTVVGRTMQEVSAFVSEKLAPMESVQATVTHFLLKRYKDQGIIMEGGDRPQRLQVSP
ncbi:MAG TPA: Lrp/AsnC family transcriptional regulator, partial [Dehalococcoidia bacterium]|nr:Lrp/AsnC family transcriptional regulator [Dehalococcoidia bacterium]